MLRGTDGGETTLEVLKRLTADPDPALRALARRDLCRESPPTDAALDSPLVQGLLSGITSDAAPRRVYAKWSGAHWRLVSLVELGVPAGHPEAVAACDRVLEHWSSRRRLAAVPVIEGRARRCASQEGDAVAVACRLGLHDEPRVSALVEHLLAWQWPDGGWNCDRRPGAQHSTAQHSSFNETLPALWGLTEYAGAGRDGACRSAIQRAAELLLDHEVAFSQRTGAPIHPSVVELHYPPYWHVDVLQALLCSPAPGSVTTCARSGPGTWSRTIGGPTARGVLSGGGGGRPAGRAAASRRSTGARQRTAW